MACYSPLQGWRDSCGAIVFSRRKGTDAEVTVPCYTCVGCRIARTRMWALRIVHESKLWDRNSFVTLTYAPEHLPPYGSLRYSDVQLFHKRLRKAVGPFRFFCVGEYGENLSRPHYHLCYFGYFPDDARKLLSSDEKLPAYSSASLSEIWGLGHVHVGSLTYQSARYCAGYIFKKQYGDRGDIRYAVVDADGVVNRVMPEFARMSLRPGIGASWYRRYASDFHTFDVAVLDGKRFPVPKYYDVLLERENPDRLAELREDRELNALRFREDNSPDRLAVKAVVAAAGVADADHRMRVK
nr:replication associated protein [Flumine microvirus 31]